MARPKKKSEKESKKDVPETPVKGSGEVPPPDQGGKGASADGADGGDMNRGHIVPTEIENEMKDSYLDYAMSVIVGRALPDVRDGLKPVHRRIFMGMHDLGLTSRKPYRKSAKVTGDVTGNYHPHGTVAVYDTIVRLAQDFSMRYVLVDGQGNFGSVDGDPPAAERYTEVRMSALAEELLKDIDKNTVEFVPNYDGTREEPLVLPCAFPNFLVNGSTGIAVGMATNVPPHNLGEVIDGLLHLIDHPEATIKDLIKFIQGPDFPTGGYILGRDGIVDAYTSGRGSVRLQAKAGIEVDKKDREKIIISELPYQVNKAQLIEKIAELVRDKKIEGISDLRDESDRDGMRIVIEVSKNANGQVLLNNLFQQTNLRTSFGIIMLALVNGQPRVLNLKGLLHHYLEHRKDVVIRRTKFDLDKAEKRAHILEGLRIAVDNLDKVIKTIRASKSTEEAKASLIKLFDLSPVQAQAILEMQLRQLTNLEIKKIEDEYKELLKTIEILKGILGSEKKLWQVIKDELAEIKAKFADPRRSEIIGKAQDMKIEDLIEDEQVVITLSHAGYIKRLPIDTYHKQKRGGKGVAGATMREEDFIERMYMASTHDYLLIFTSFGKVHWLKVYEIPEASRYAKGTALANVLKLGEGEAISAVLSVKEFNEKSAVLMATEQGLIKNTPLSAFDKPRAGGIIAITLGKGDKLVSAEITDGKQDIFLATRQGMSIRFQEKQVREVGRTGKGVRGCRLGKNDSVIGMVVVEDGKTLLTSTEKGYGKRTQMKQYRRQGRGGKGILNIKTTSKNGLAVGIAVVGDGDEIIVMTKEGKVIRQRVREIKTTGRLAQGVRLIKMSDSDRLVAVVNVPKEEEGNGEK
ncbi:MAG TPA: DNA gyrase subunit A [bacterium]|nr:DNA gyrase subunit A [bacterium]